jgi:uncharacterized protein (TIGR02246 family)
MSHYDSSKALLDDPYFMNESYAEEQIRELIAAWLRATSDGDLTRVLSLMTEDVVFLAPGQPPMRGREAFAAGFRAMLQQVRIEGVSDIQEIASQATTLTVGAISL